MLSFLGDGKQFTIPEGLLLALIGFVLVLVVLVVLMGIIYLLTFLVRRFENKFKKTDSLAAEASVVESASPELAPGSSGDVKLYNVNERTAAMVMAIVADELQTPLNELRFISIKEVTEEGK